MDTTILSKSASEIAKLIHELTTASSLREFSIEWASPTLFEYVLLWGLDDLPKIVKYQILWFLTRWTLEISYQDRHYCHYKQFVNYCMLTRRYGWKLDFIGEIIPGYTPYKSDLYVLEASVDAIIHLHEKRIKEGIMTKELTQELSQQLISTMRLIRCNSDDGYLSWWNSYRLKRESSALLDEAWSEIPSPWIVRITVVLKQWMRNEDSSNCLPGPAKDIIIRTLIADRCTY